MRTIGIALLLVGGMLFTVFYTYIIGLAGAPGALLSVAAAKRSPKGITPPLGLFLTIAGQLYASLAFVVLVINFMETHFCEVIGLRKRIIWGIAFFVAMIPITIALKDATYCKRRNIQHYAITFTAPLTALGFFLFQFFPTIMNTVWGWVPQL